MNEKNSSHLKYKKKRKGKNNQNNLISSLLDEEEESTDYIDIWTINPFHRDINLKHIKYKLVLLAILVLPTLLFIMAISPQINYILFGLSVLMILLFHDHLFNFFNNIFSRFQGVIRIDPYKDLLFLTLESDLETLYVVNKKNSLILAMRIFEVKVLPENVQATLNHFLKALYNANIKYSYQVVQTPILNQISDITSNINNETSIYFCVFEQERGLLIKRRIENLIHTVHHSSNVFKSHVSSNFHHTKFSLLGGYELIRAMRTLFCGVQVERIEDKEDNSKSDIEFVIHCLLKIIIIAIIVLSFSYFLIYLAISWWLISIMDFIIAILFLSIWWQDLLFFISNFCFLRKTNLRAFNPFIDIKFFREKGCKGSIFMLFQKNLLIGIKIFNLKHAFQKSYILFDKFFRELNNNKISFIYTLQATPLLAEHFTAKCERFLNEKGESDLERIFGRTIWDGYSMSPLKNADLHFSNWLNMRSGIWKTMLTISALVYKYVDPSDFNYFLDLEEELIQKSEIMINAFEDNFLNLKLQQLSNQKLLNGFQFACLKNSLFKDKNTKLYSVYFQGKNLMYLNSLSNEFKKGLETRIAAEFNTPLHLKNDIVIGKTINTEFLEGEVELGFTYDQVRNLLITNGLSEQRENTMMKIVIELTKLGKSCIIFDYSGKWSKLINYFEDSYWQKAFLYFKLGRSFSINLINSDIKYDKKNVEYLNLFFDVFALAFKEQKRIVDLLKENVSKNEILSLEDMALNQEMEKEIIKQNQYNSLLSLLHGFVDWRSLFATKGLESHQEIKSIDFIRNNKSIIIDLSLVEEMNQKNFVSFVILSKLIHYLKNGEDYQEKIIIIPDIDLFFDANYIDNYNSPVDFGKISKFIDPILAKGCGFIFSANQPRYLHSHIFNYFPNMITFKATDTRDIAVLKNQMNLQELQGTGYYSSKRNNTYQIDYLKNLRKNEILVKRSDIFQPFPGEIENDHLHLIPIPSREYIADYMKEQGFDYIDNEQKILAGAKKTLFEKDLGIYSRFIEEIIKYFDAVGCVDKIGGLYENKLKDLLLEYITPKASKKIQNKKKISELRNFIFQLLKTHGYLVESHPPKASGSQTTRTCFEVGNKYYEALDDYYKRTEGFTPKISIETIEKESRDFFSIPKTAFLNNSENIKKVFNEKEADLVWDLYQLYKLNKQKDYLLALKKGKEIISKFLVKVFEEYLKIEPKRDSYIKDYPSFLNYLTQYQIIPFDASVLKEFINKSRELSEGASNLELNATELEELLNEFYRALYYHIKNK